MSSTTVPYSVRLTTRREAEPHRQCVTDPHISRDDPGIRFSIGQAEIGVEGEGVLS